ncbi:3-beta hydroxysteroid dehydrogenase [Staphylococcus arlettae]|uniref:3-beta hydroxysteroid dehydrogenase n=1 Tax=Staphylococcus arlettae TaxID=29378 RepID=A0A380CNI6_9STAP|nr:MULTISPECIES: 3-beta hydroxysteroid dehydrogenase [Staphylococcus]KAB2480877.1 3-beta hydroxysteroid dehydrogenase [Staphylococcus sp. CH99b_3]MCD8816407.1 3-beta hydroxysteroid dehydrogenase [Staphylococcus arlettae]MCD8839682.1 3-beta hydroxysteroid dehydrogenase [Staphylococcus arlettae]MCD8848884.1 3-beta hydroxysteroid dehydrogenase [Staphylococcus arlettae]MCD8867191.1 3-beta hydroxysteroid dehydrogenase [Staphylococcus arlettae]
MKPNVLLAGVTGYIGKNLIPAIKNDAQLFTLSKYPKEQDIQEVTWLKKDIYNYHDVVAAMQNIDIAIFYLDPTKHSAKLTQASAKDMNRLASDNFGRAAAANKVQKIIYIPGSIFDNETIARLSAYGVTVETTEHRVERPTVAVELQVSKYDDVRSAMSIQLPMHWTLEQLVQYYISWINQTRGTFMYSYQVKDDYIIYRKNKQKPLLVLHKHQTSDDIITLHLVGGTLVKPNAKKQGKLEFRKLRGTTEVMVHLFDYIPRLVWPVYYLCQAPIQSLMMRGFEIDCRIKNFQGRIQAGEDIKYTK